MLGIQTLAFVLVEQTLLPTYPFPSLYFNILKQETKVIAARKSKSFDPARWKCLCTSSSPRPCVWVTREDGEGAGQRRKYMQTLTPRPKLPVTAIAEVLGQAQI